PGVSHRPYRADPLLHADSPRLVHALQFAQPADARPAVPPFFTCPPMTDLKRVALVHDWLTGMRGGERVLEVFCERFPHADRFTLVPHPERVSPAIARMQSVPSFLQKLPGGVSRYRYYLPLFPLAISRFHLRGYDLVLSSSHAVAKGI